MKFEFFDDIGKFYNEKLAKEAFEFVLNERESSQIGYYSLPDSSMVILRRLENLKQQNFFNIIENIVIIGIGGSSLGTKAFNSLLRHTNPNLKNLVFLENSDPINISLYLKNITKENSIFCIVSKSGTTIETISIFKTVLAKFNIDLHKDAKQLVVITDFDSALSKFAKQFGITEFNIPNNVGGRFSVLSAVGIVPLFLAGYDVKQILTSAKSMFENFWQQKDNSILRLGCYFYKHHDSLPMSVLFSYSNLLEDFTKWYVQLWGESLGKINIYGDKVGLTPIGLIGSVDQHSFLQLIIEGPKNKTVTFLNIEDFTNDLEIADIKLPFLEKTDFVNGIKFTNLINAQCDATFQSLKECEVNTQKITIEKLNEESIAEAIVYFELLTSVVGAMLKINTYDQPGVELGKNILTQNFKKDSK